MFENFDTTATMCKNFNNNFNNFRINRVFKKRLLS